MEKLKPCYLSDGTEETGKRIIEELMKVEGATNRYYINAVYKIPEYYFLDKDNDVDCSCSIPEGYVLTPLPKETKELTFPRWMIVYGRKEFVLTDLGESCNYRYIYLGEEDYIKYKNGEKYNWRCIHEAKEIESDPIKEETLEERLEAIEKYLKLK